MPTLFTQGGKFQEDNSSIHEYKISTAYRNFRDIRTIDWQANSPDLNPIKNLWPVLNIESKLVPQGA